MLSINEVNKWGSQRIIVGLENGVRVYGVIVGSNPPTTTGNWLICPNLNILEYQLTGDKNLLKRLPHADIKQIDPQIAMISLV